MLKHASPQRPSSSLAQHLPPSPAALHPSDTRRKVHVEGSSSVVDFAFRDSYSERSVDCDSLIVPASYAQAQKQAGYQVGTWTGVSQANVRRGLSFSSRRAPDALSFRSVRSEGQPASLSLASPPSKMPHSSTSMLNVSTLRSEAPGPKGDRERQETNLQYLKGDMSSLKNLLRLPGVRGPAKIVELSKDGVILNPDSLSLNSSDSFFTANTGRTSSRSWSSNASSNSSGTNASTGSNSSTSEPASTTIRVFAKCLRSDIEYKTISVSSRATCREVVALLLSKYRMRHRDPNLFYLTMEVTVRRWSGSPVRSLLVLEDGARPAQLALCRPPGDSRFALQMRRGGVVKVHDTLLMPGSQYKSLLVSDRTTAEEVVQLLLNCYNRRDNKYYYAIHEVRRSPQYNDRMILSEERLLDVKAKWPRDRQAEFVFVLRRNMSQALSLRKLSLRTSDIKRGPADASIKEEDKPFPNTQHAKAEEDQVRIFVVEEAVIDCTDATPKMTTINRTTTTSSCCKGTAEVFPMKTSASTLVNRPPHARAVSEVPPPASVMRDNATNTDAKMWSNTSTQTVVSGQVLRPAPTAREEDPVGKPKPRETQNPPKETVRPSTEDSKSLTRHNSQDPRHIETKMTTIENQKEEAKKTSQNDQIKERQLQKYPCEVASDNSGCSSGPKITGSSQITPQTNMSVTLRPEIRHMCKHNCQHCFYI